VRLQHPLGLAFSAGRLYLADTYNHKIKMVDPATGEVQTLAGTGKPGTEKGDSPHLPERPGGCFAQMGTVPFFSASFYEPGGLAVAAGNLYVADTNNHLVRVIDLASRQVSTLAIPGLRPPQPPAAPKPLTAKGPPP